MTETEFVSLAHRNPVNQALLDRLADIALPDCFLVAGCLFQAVWNAKSGRDPAAGVYDYDVFYFDERDLTKDAELDVEKQVEDAVEDLGIKVDVKNQARVHTWYGEKFGPGYPKLEDSRDGIRRYLVACTCVGIAIGDRRVFAPNGFDDLGRGILRMNPVNPRPANFRKKAESYRSRWPWLTIVDPDADGAGVS